MDESTVIGHFQFEKELGHGEQSTVSRAMDTRLYREVAIKQSNRLASSDPAYADHDGGQTWTSQLSGGSLLDYRLLWL